VLEVEKVVIELSIAKNLKRPQFDIIGSAGLNGIDSSFGRSISNTFDGDYPELSLGVSISIPWGNNEAKGREREAVMRRTRAERQADNARTRASVDVRTAVEAISVLEDRLRRVRAYREHFTKEVSEESIRLERGETTLVQLVQFQRALADARVREMSAITQLHQAHVQLRTADASILNYLGLEFEP